MPRKIQWNVLPPPQVHCGQPYPVKVLNIEKAPHSDGIILELMHRSPELYGLRQSLRLPPLYADGPSCQLFKAAGCDLSSGKVSPADVLGKLILATFEPADDGNSIIAASFETLHSISKQDHENE